MKKQKKIYRILIFAKMFERAMDTAVELLYSKVDIGNKGRHMSLRSILLQL